MEQIIQKLSMDEEKNECLEPDLKKEKIFDFHLAKVKGMQLGEKEEIPAKPEESECSAGSTKGNTGRECSVDEVLSKSENYGMTWCTYPKQHGFTSVCRSFRKYDERNQVLIQSLGQTIIHRDIVVPRRRRACMNHCISDMMTIHYYKSNTDDQRNGRPVILNFSGLKLFLKCMYKDDKAVLMVEDLENEKLKSICKSDKNTWPFVFFLSTTKDNFCRFESAACSGWFIHMRSDLLYACTRVEGKEKENTFSIYPRNSLIR